MTLPGEAVNAAGERSRERGTARVESFTVVGSPVPESGDSRAGGIVDFVADRAYVAARLLTDRMRQDSQDRDGRVLRELKGIFGQSAELIFDGGRKYNSTTPGRWIADGEIAGPRQQLDPLWVLDVLAGTHEDATPVGDADVRGATTHRYRLTSDLQRADERSPLGLVLSQAPRRWFRRGASDLGWQRRVPVEVWLDDAGCVRRISVAPLDPRDAPEATSTIWSVSEFWDFGTSVNIAIPD